MKKLTLLAGVFTFVLTSAFVIIESINWKVKEDSYGVHFKGGKIDGVMKGLKATIEFDEANPTKSKIVATVDVKTISTGSGMKDQHALAESALNGDVYPTIKFESTTITGKSGAYHAVGKLTIKGVTKEIFLPFTFDGKDFKGKFKIVPAEYNVTRMGTPDVLEIELTIPVTK